ncbi:MAG: hypothetical protein GXY44_13135 [Phycisphaerales bacterium]|nr:hypothetical protein [Phycisphaerales bacterium]
MLAQDWPISADMRVYWMRGPSWEVPDLRGTSMHARRRPHVSFVILSWGIFCILVTPTLGQMSYLNNGVIRIGVDLSKGGSITYLADAGTGQNMINSYDLGRQIQQSYYSGPSNFDPYNNQHPSWSPWSWNPIQSGDVYGHRGTVLQHSNNQTEIYVKSRPMQWALNNVPGEATFETWIRLEGTAARVRARLTNARTDTAELFSARHQEMPAVYTIGLLHRLFTYQGLEPWTNGTLSEIGHVPPPWVNWRATEGWAALVNNSGWGLGLYRADGTLFIGGFAGTPDTGGPTSSHTGHMSCLFREHLDSNIVFEYEYAIILGWLSDIRTWVYQQPRTTRPTYHFANNRQHWHSQGAFDTGFPIDGSLRFPLAGAPPILIGPPCAFYAADVPTMYIRAAYQTASARTGRLYWELNNEGITGGVFPIEQSMTFTTIPDGEFHTYVLPLESEPSYTGLLSRLRFDPGHGGMSGESVQIQYISATRLPEIETSVTKLERSVYYGTTLSNETFTVRNAGSGTINFSIADDAPWLNVTPSTGTSSGEAKTFNISYSTAGMALGEYNATITVVDPNAINSPRTIPVMLHVRPTMAMRADFDGDGDVDMADFGHLQACYSGSGMPPVAGCENADLDGNNTIDQNDFTLFRQCLSGTNIPVNPLCGQ